MSNESEPGQGRSVKGAAAEGVETSPCVRCLGRCRRCSGLSHFVKRYHGREGVCILRQLLSQP